MSLELFDPFGFLLALLIRLDLLLHFIIDLSLYVLKTLLSLFYVLLRKRCSETDLGCMLL
jgi:hypothetical protein